MKVYDAASIRNVTIAGHSGAGKTQLAATILFDAGMINRFGKVDDGTTVGALVQRIGLADEARITFVNGRHAPDVYALVEGDRLAIFPPVAGG